MYAVPNGCEEVKDLAIIGVRVAHPVCGQQWQLQRTSDTNRRLIAPLFFTLMVSLQLHIDVSGTKDAHEAFHQVAPGFFAASCQSTGKRPLIPARKTNQTTRVILNLFELCRTVSLSSLPQLESCD